MSTVQKGDKILPGLYRIKIDASGMLRITDLTIADKYYLASIYSSCAMNQFTAEQCSSVTSMSRKRAHEYLDRLCERGIAAKDKPLINRPGVFRLLISPADYPDCFQSTEQRPTQTKAQTAGKAFTAIAI
ncbi:MAG: hypothetical protein IKH57_06585 [Clostridia bacterium]|nr:hypothetical protein [Clostridia bacterium]